MTTRNPHGRADDAFLREGPPRHGVEAWCGGGALTEGCFGGADKQRCSQHEASSAHDQYLQLFVSAPGGAVFCQCAAKAGMNRLL